MAKCNASSPLRMRMRMPVRENLYEIRWVRGWLWGYASDESTSTTSTSTRPSLALDPAQLRAVGRVESSRVGEVGWHIG